MPVPMLSNSPRPPPFIFTDKGTFHSVTFERRYRDAEGNWHSTHSYEASDLLLLAKLSDQVHSKILELRPAKAAA